RAIAQPAIISTSSLRSIIVKLRSTAAMNDGSLLAKLRSISSSSDALRPVFKLPVQGATPQTIGLIGRIGLDRIVQVSLREGMTAEDAVRSLSGNQAFEYIEPNYKYHIQSMKAGGEDATRHATANSFAVVIPNDPLFGSQWGLRNVHAPEAWEITEGDSTIHIGFVDTGVDWLHPDLQFQFAVNPTEDINHNGLFDAWPADSIGK